MQKLSLVFAFCVCFLLYALLRYPAAMLAASAAGVSLWLTKVFPSLFPFLVACGLLLRIGAAERLGKCLRPLMRPLFGLDGIAAFPFFLGILSGYPMGAKITALLYEKRRISLEDVAHILVFSNNAGPLFLIGTIGTGFFGVPAFGYLLLLCSGLGAVASGILWRFLLKKRRNEKAQPCARRYPAAAPPAPMEALSLSMQDAMQTILLIGGYLIFFATLTEALRQAGFFSLLARLCFFLPLAPETIQGFCGGLLEMTNGAYLLSLSPDTPRLRLSLIAFLIAFGGLSILGQTFGVLAAVPIRKRDYLKGKLCHALLSGVFCWAFFPFFAESTQKAVPAFFSFTETAFTLSFLWLLPGLFFLYALFRAFFLRK